jgi:zinc/manganese transport system substrate-binding protein
MVLTGGARKQQRPVALVLLSAILTFAVLSCCSAATTDAAGKKVIVVTYSVLGSLVRDAVGDQAIVQVMIPNGSDPHEWEPSAKAIEALNHATLIVRNGLDLEGGMLRALNRAQESGVPTFVATDHVTLRRVAKGEGLPTGDADQAAGAQDPHVWMDPLTLKSVLKALLPILSAQGIDAAAGIETVTTGLDSLDRQITRALGEIPDQNRKLVTGHESLGYFANRYRFRLVGTIIPSLTSQAGVAARGLSALTATIRTEKVKAIFSEIGTPSAVAEAIGAEAHVKVVSIASHNLPPDRKYATFLLETVKKIVAALK